MHFFSMLKLSKLQRYVICHYLHWCQKIKKMIHMDHWYVNSRIQIRSHEYGSKFCYKNCNTILIFEIRYHIVSPDIKLINIA